MDTNQKKTLLGFDLETTGVSITKDRIVQISAIKFSESFEIIEKKKMLINPTISIPEGATKVHGITNEMVKDAYTFKQLSKGIMNFFLGCVLVTFNGKKFDIPLLLEEFKRSETDFPTDNLEFIDCLKIYHDKNPRNLEAALKHYCGKSILNAHDAEADVLSTIDVLEGQLFAHDLDIESSIKASKDENEIDLEGKLILIDGIPCFNFGKSKGNPIKSDLGYANWMLGGEFSSNTKDILRKLM